MEMLGLSHPSISCEMTGSEQSTAFQPILTSSLGECNGIAWGSPNPSKYTAPFLAILPLIFAVNMAAQNTDHISPPSLHPSHVTKFWPMR